jgi:Co/Zn/Cd efflux system component
MLSWISLGWLGVEGLVAILAAVLAGSVALLGFGIDTAIEALASIIVVWRFSGTRIGSATAETRAQKAVAVSFFLLAPYIAVESIRVLVLEHHAETTWLGISLAAVSLMWCPALGVMKRRLGARLNSPATIGEGCQNLLCAYLAVTVLVGLLANTLFGIWWLDPSVGLLIAVLALKEGWHSWRQAEPADICACCGPPLPPTEAECAQHAQHDHGEREHRDNRHAYRGDGSQYRPVGRRTKHRAPVGQDEHVAEQDRRDDAVEHLRTHEEVDEVAGQ